MEANLLDTDKIVVKANKINLAVDRPSHEEMICLAPRNWGKTYYDYMTGECVNRNKGGVISTSIYREDDYMIDRIKKYIINDKAVIIFWKDGNKTVAVCDKEDTYDKELGFLIAFFKYANRHESKSELKRLFTYIKDENLKDYLLIIFNRFTFKDYEKSRKYLKNLKEGTIYVK